MNTENNEKKVTFDIADIDFVIKVLYELNIKGADCFRLAGIIQTLQQKGTTE